MKTYPYLNILMFPTTECNLRCKYCFHANDGYKKENMNIASVERIFTILFPKYDYLQFIWHGGEPLCIGLDFYKDMIDIQQNYAQKYGVLVDNGIMTNGVLVNEKIAQFLSKNQFDVGVSFDGIHNEELRGMTDKVKAGISLLNQYNCNLDIVTVITSRNMNDQIANYEYIKQFGAEIKFNPVARIGGGETNKDCILDVNEYVVQCCNMFEYWLIDKNKPVKLQPYYQYLRDLLENTSSGCQRTSCLGRWIALHPNGDIYPCVRENRYDFCFGNIFKLSNIEDMWDSEAFMYLLNSSVDRRQQCEKCSVFKHCQGGCPVNAVTGNAIFSCVTFQKIFSYVKIYYQTILQMSKQEREEQINPIICDLFASHNS